MELRAEAISILDSLTLRTLKDLRPGKDKTKLGGRVLPNDVEWREAADFFLPKLAIVNGSKKAFPGCVAISGQADVVSKTGGTPILPTRRELLLYLGAEWLGVNARYRVIGDEVEVSVAIPTTSGARNHRAEGLFTQRQVHNGAGFPRRCLRFGRPSMIRNGLYILRSGASGRRR